MLRDPLRVEPADVTKRRLAEFRAALAMVGARVGPFGQGFEILCNSNTADAVREIAERYDVKLGTPRNT